MRKSTDKKLIVSIILGMVFCFTPIVNASATEVPGVIDNTVIDDYIATEMDYGKIKGLAISIVHGTISPYDKCFESKQKLEDVIQQMVSHSNRIINEACPIVFANTQLVYLFHKYY